MCFFCLARSLKIPVQVQVQVNQLDIVIYIYIYKYILSITISTEYVMIITMPATFRPSPPFDATLVPCSWMLTLKKDQLRLRLCRSDVPAALATDVSGPVKYCRS